MFFPLAALFLTSFVLMGQALVPIIAFEKTITISAK